MHNPKKSWRYEQNWHKKYRQCIKFSKKSQVVFEFSRQKSILEFSGAILTILAWKIRIFKIRHFWWFWTTVHHPTFPYKMSKECIFNYRQISWGLERLKLFNYKTFFFIASRIFLESSLIVQNLLNLYFFQVQFVVQYNMCVLKLVFLANCKVSQCVKCPFLVQKFIFWKDF